MRKLIFICLLVGTIISCEKKDDNDIEIKQISYGTSFGMCSGYCKTDIY